MTIVIIMMIMMFEYYYDADYHLVQLLGGHKHLVFAHLQVALQVLDSPVTKQIGREVMKNWKS